MKARLTLVMLAMAALLPMAAVAQTIGDGHSLKKRCATVQWTSPSAGLGCRGYIGAVLDVLADGNALYGRRACPPSNTKREAAIKAVRDWLERHPDLLVNKASVVTVRALAETYPCTK